MDLEEWLKSEDPAAVILRLWDGGRGGDRKFALFAVGYCRLERPLDERVRDGIQLLERFAEGLATAEEVAATHGRTWAARMYEFLEEMLVRRSERNAEVDGRRLTALFRCVFGDPRRPLPSVSPSLLVWNDGCVVKLATALYEERAFDRLPLLADALEDAGCMEADILSHCRDREAIHARGCWVVDVLLGKS